MVDVLSLYVVHGEWTGIHIMLRMHKTMVKPAVVWDTNKPVQCRMIDSVIKGFLAAALS